MRVIEKQLEKQVEKGSVPCIATLCSFPHSSVDHSFAKSGLCHCVYAAAERSFARRRFWLLTMLSQRAQGPHRQKTRKGKGCEAQNLNRRARRAQRGEKTTSVSSVPSCSSKTFPELRVASAIASSRNGLCRLSEATHALRKSATIHIRRCHHSQDGSPERPRLILARWKEWKRECPRVNPSLRLSTQ